MMCVKTLEALPYKVYGSFLYIVAGIDPPPPAQISRKLYNSILSPLYLFFYCHPESLAYLSILECSLSQQHVERRLTSNQPIVYSSEEKY